MPYGYGRGGGRGGGFGFRGSSPPWPYVGRGRGGFPRGAYYWGGVTTAYAPRLGYPAAGYATSLAPMSKDEELNYLNDQARTVRAQLIDIEARIKDLEPKSTE